MVGKHVHRATADGARQAKRRATKARKNPLQPVDVTRQLKCLELRLAGWQYHAIAKELGYADASGPYHAVQAALKAHLAEDVIRYQQVMILRLDELLKALRPGIKRGSVRHIEAALRVEERRARFMGLDRPLKHDVHIESLAELVAAIDPNDPPAPKPE